MRFWKDFYRNQKGLTMIELLCAITIFGVALAAVGGIMIISANQYNRGSLEVELQQEAQITSNLITNMIINSMKAAWNSEQNTLTIYGADGINSQIVFEGEENRLLYYRDGLKGILAENVKAFYVKDTILEEEDPDGAGNLIDLSRTVQVVLRIANGSDASGAEYREIETTFEVTSRNGN